jgi:hypothetical protein
MATVAMQHKSKKRQQMYGKRDSKGGQYLSVLPDFSDLWRLDKVVNLIKDGAVCIALPRSTHCTVSSTAE